MKKTMIDNSNPPIYTLLPKVEVIWVLTFILFSIIVLSFNCAPQPTGPAYSNTENTEINSPGTAQAALDTAGIFTNSAVSPDN